MRRDAILLIVVIAALEATACVTDGEDGSFELYVGIDNKAPYGTEFWVNGQPATPESGSQHFFTGTWGSYDEALAEGVTIESRTPDGNTSRCVLYAGACADSCTPDRETALICANGELFIGDLGCPCDDGGEITDYFCAVPCSVTGPQ